jgi:putative inorganic carbon (hco3(-)) transporter
LSHLTDNFVDTFFAFEIIPALVLVFLRSKWLLPYLLLLWAVGPEVRRVDDWIFGGFQATNLLAVSPLICSLVLVVPVVRRWSKVSLGIKRGVGLMAVGLCWGAFIGVFHNGAAMAVDLAQFAIPILVLLYLATFPYTAKDQGLLFSSYSLIAVAVSVYCWIQFVLMPDWDAFWLTNCYPPMPSEGQPLPLLVRPWSSLNSSGPCAAFIGLSLVAMILDSRWRRPFGWIGVFVVASALAITEVRTALIECFVMVISYLAISSGKNKVRVLISTVAVLIGLSILTPYLPGSQAVTQRMSTLGAIQNDGSAQARAQALGPQIAIVLSNPLGHGLGFAGGGRDKLGTNDVASEGTIGDNGYLEILSSLGLIGGIPFFGGIISIFRYEWRSLKRRTDSYARLSIATYAGTAFALASGNALVAVYGIVAWLMVGSYFLGVEVAPIRVEVVDEPSFEPLLQS